MSGSSFRTLSILLTSVAIGLVLHACKPDTPTGPSDNRRPTAAIRLPGNGSSFVQSESVSFEGSATDPEDGLLTGSSLVWTSSIDGQIGLGLQFSRSDLSVGTHTIRLVATDSEGAADTATASIGVGGVPNQDPTASFSFSCSNLTCTFTDGSTDPDGTIVAWSWQFGDGATSNLQNPQHTFATAGMFDVTLTATDDGGATDDVMRQVSVNPQNQGPTASFSVVCDLLSCEFTDASTDSDGTVEAWSWQFGDGATSDQRNPQHTYAAGGAYSVTLEVTDDDGGTGQAAQQVTANEKPLADFSFLCTGRVCQFADLSTDPDGSIVARSWTFGDGASSTQSNPSHTYSADGNYDVRLIVTDNASAKDTVTKDVGAVQPNQPPVAAFSNSCPNLSCDFTDESTDSDGTVEGWQWDFGDGSSSTGQNPSHTYAAEGTYTVTLTVTDDDGAASDPAASREISVSPANQGPTADFAFSCVNLVCQFSDGSDDPDGTITSRSWDFGDGNGSAQTNPTHAYASKGEYTVKLDVTDNDGATGQISKPVSVNTTPTVAILQPSNGATFNKGATVQFQGTANDADGDGLTLAWESSLDGTLSSVASFTRSNLSVGVHVISFIASDGTAADTAQRTITIVNQAPTAAITAPTGGSVFNLGSSVGFSGSGTDPEDGTLGGAALAWSSSLDGDIGFGVSFSLSDLSAGSHLIRLVVTDTDGASDTATVSIRINAPPAATITDPADGSSFTVGTNVSFRGTGEDAEDGSLSGGELVWSSSLDDVFGSGSPTNENGLSIGTHQITLIATDTDGATGTDQITVTITAAANQAPTATISAPSQDTTVTQGDAVTFTGTGSDPEDGPLTGASLQWESSLDGNIGSGVTFAKSDLTLGAHTIRLIATDSQSAADTATVVVTVTAPANQAPTATISAPSQDTTVTQGDAVTFTGTGSDPEDGPLTDASLQWESSLDGNIGSGVSVAESGLTLGVHTIRLIATDSQASADTATVVVTVNAPANQAPTAGFTSSCTNLVCDFADTSTDPDGTVVGWAWEFGDGEISSQQSPQHTYSVGGPHTVSLVVTDDDATSSSPATEQISLSSPILGGYQIEVRESPGVTLTASQRTAVDNAAARWESLITSDLSSIPALLAAGTCGGASVPALNETIDDLVIYLEFVPIDGVGGTLGSAGPCQIRGAGNLPLLGGMKFDTADLANLEAQGRLEDVIVHEMGHVLGIGTLWSLFGLLNDPTSPSPAVINDTWFSGTAATAAFNSIGGTGYTDGAIVPLENNNLAYGEGSLNRHWRESVFSNELMSPAIGFGANPLSVVTTESLADLGYAVNSSGADTFTLSLSLVESEQAPVIRLDNDIWQGPIEIVDAQGRVTGSFRAF